MVAALPGGGRIGSVETDSAGAFTVRAWRAGTFTLEVTHPSYRTTTVAVEAGLAERIEVKIRMSFTAAVLEPLEVLARASLALPAMGLAGFEERRRWGERLGLGRFLATDAGCQFVTR